jgi:hypothetical protein
VHIRIVKLFAQALSREFPSSSCPVIEGSSLSDLRSTGL